MSAGRRLWPGLVVTGLLLAATIANLALLAHPLWMWPAAIIMIPAAGWAAARAAAGPQRGAREPPSTVTAVPG